MTTASGPTDARPLAVRVADDLRMRIETGDLAAGQQLPTLDVIAERYRSSLAVARKAMELLRSQGLVVTRQGKGTFVRGRARTRRHGIDRYSRSRWRSGTPILTGEAEKQGYQADQVIRELAEVPAPGVVAERLGIKPGEPVWVRRRTTASMTGQTSSPTATTRSTSSRGRSSARRTPDQAADSPGWKRLDTRWSESARNSRCGCHIPTR